jgi:hypothetical protein
MEKDPRRINVGNFSMLIHPVEPPPDFISDIPIGLERLSVDSIQDLLTQLKLPENNPNLLASLTPTELFQLAKNNEYFGRAGIYAKEMPERAGNIRKALRDRAKLLIESAKHDGFNIPGAQDLETHLAEIHRAFYGPEHEPDDGFPF